MKEADAKVLSEVDVKHADAEAADAAPQPLLLRDISFPREPPQLVRGLSRTECQNESLANLVITALRDRGWGSVSAADVLVEDKSGGGGSACFKVSAENADPSIVALHSQSVDASSAPHFTGRMADAAKVFADSGLGPRRLAYGGDWFIEVWEGTGQPTFDCNQIGLEGAATKFKELGKLVADVHRLPTEWFDSWREKACERRPVLHEIPHNSHAWWFTCKTWECYECLPSDEECLQFWLKDTPCFAPSSSILSRLVTSHGDCHPGNLIETEAGMRLLDFEYTTVSSAMFDVGFVFMWAGEGPDGKKKKRAFLEEYMASSGLPADAETIDKVYLDAEFHIVATHCGPLWDVVRKNDKERMQLIESLLGKARQDPGTVTTIMEQGIRPALESMEAEMVVEKGKDFSSFDQLVSDGEVDQCWFIKMAAGAQNCVQANLTDGTYVRFSLSGNRYLGQGSFTLRQGVYVESSREG